MFSSLIRAALIKEIDADKYRKNCSFGFGMEISGGVARYCFKLVKALSLSSIHLSCLLHFKAWKKGWHLLEHLEMNFLSAIIIPVSFLHFLDRGRSSNVSESFNFLWIRLYAPLIN